MSTIGASEVHDLSPEDNPDNLIYGTHPASDAAVAAVLAADPESPDGRSEWVWVRMCNGDLVLGVFPQGDTYFQHEAEHSV